MSERFHSRFNINFSAEDAKGNFINRIVNELQDLMKGIQYSGDFRNSPKRVDETLKVFLQLCGKKFTPSGSRSYYSAESFMRIWEEEIVADDFLKCLEALERLHLALKHTYPSFNRDLEELVARVLSLSEVDLGLTWHNGIFTKKGAALLDKDLVNDSLRWLSDPKHKDILLPFEKGLKHFIEGDRNPDRRGDAVTDMYEAMEALARLVTNQPSKDLSALRETFIGKLRLPDAYRRMLKEYIDYGCDFRHAVQPGQPRSWPSVHETEAFVYLTGLFIRLAIQSSREVRD